MYTYPCMTHQHFQISFLPRQYVNCKAHTNCSLNERDLDKGTVLCDFLTRLFVLSLWLNLVYTFIFSYYINTLPPGFFICGFHHFYCITFLPVFLRTPFQNLDFYLDFFVIIYILSYNFLSFCCLVIS
jgi:hypothetical protein